MADNILEVKRLKISFRTNNGLVRAVRDISFDLERGKTLAIVGESGSGKSVTSKAILGISAGNAVLDGGEILFDGKDLCRLTEEEMHKIRGDKIAMIFQDPLSSLDPIVKIGQQITEGMIIKNRATRKNSRNEFNALLKLLQENIIETMDSNDKEGIEEVKRMTKKFDDFNIQALKLENNYNTSVSRVQEIQSKIDDFLFKASKYQKLDTRVEIKSYLTMLKDVTDPFLLQRFIDRLNAQKAVLQSLAAKSENQLEEKVDVKGANVTAVTNEVIYALTNFKELLVEMEQQEAPNYFRIGYYMMENPTAVLYTKPIDEVNEMCLQYLNTNFMNKFLELETKGVKNSYNKALEGKKKLLPLLEDFKAFVKAKNFDKTELKNKVKALAFTVEESIDKLATVKDSTAYTFVDALVMHIESYFNGVINNEKEEKRFARQTARREALIAKGKTVDWKVVPKKIVDLDDVCEDICSATDRMISNYTKVIEASSEVDYQALAITLIDYFKETASKVVYKVTKSIAKEKAIKLMEEVGIPDPRIRFYQYPFEFSGGMRQRIVIAIALSADPDILICDEPTTALDVTIQSQILELINKLKRERNLSIIFITHDLGVVANMADDIAVMYAGKIVEYGSSEEVFYSPAHPYTWALLSSMPDLDTKEKLESIPGTPPNMIYPPKGDAFADRNKYALKIDFEEQPPLFKITDTHYAATWLLHPNAPKVEMPKVISERIERMKKQGGNPDAK